MKIHTTFVTIDRDVEIDRFISQAINCIYDTIDEFAEIEIPDPDDDGFNFALNNNNVYASFKTIPLPNPVLYLIFDLDMGNKSKIVTMQIPIIKKFTDDIRNEIENFIKKYIKENNNYY